MNRIDPAAAWAAARARLVALADAGLAAKYARVAPTQGTILGITVPVIRRMVKEFAAGAPELTADHAVAMAGGAFASGCREQVLFAVFLVARFKRQLAPPHWRRVDCWVDALDNWEACDQLAMGVAGEMVGRAVGPQRAVYVKDLLRWAKSPNAWRRRFVVATTTVLNQKGRHDAATALRVCERLLSEGDRNVQKAVAWALREACKSDAAAVFALLKKHAAAMPRTLLRQSAEKLPQGQRAALGL